MSNNLPVQSPISPSAEKKISIQPENAEFINQWLPGTDDEKRGALENIIRFGIFPPQFERVTEPVKNIRDFESNIPGEISLDPSSQILNTYLKYSRFSSRFLIEGYDDFVTRRLPEYLKQTRLILPDGSYVRIQDVTIVPPRYPLEDQAGFRALTPMKARIAHMVYGLDVFGDFVHERIVQDPSTGQRVAIAHRSQ